MFVRLLAMTALLSGCAPVAPSEGEDRMAIDPEQIAAPVVTTREVPAIDPELRQAMTAAAEQAVPGKACLRQWFTSPDTPEQEERRRRQREISSDSWWLGRHVRENYEARLLSSGVAFRDGGWRYEVALTGSERVRLPPLGDRAKDVPVIVLYDQPWSFAEMRRRSEAVDLDAVRALVGDVAGYALVEAPGGGHIALHVVRPGGKADDAVLERCDELAALFRLPVLVDFVGSMPQLRPAPASPEPR